eukprot:snap_masked-scaffold_140-processed-gene-0.4-mRNA-1 protein AED:1.00 eAED:1.00 QI:0/-1/0/0/-1/1/1/0/67
MFASPRKMSPMENHHSGRRCSDPSIESFFLRNSSAESDQEEYLTLESKVAPNFLRISAAHLSKFNFI